MANEEHLAILRQGVEVWNKWREGNPYIRPDLSNATLPSFLGGANLVEADLSEANLRGSYLVEAALMGADLARANLITSST